ncbi:hypothetical protein ABZX30_07000 [Streptomyces sp. NPDC004542]|uniref:hypothetical protein n=1 Tax=Streptomyces sp. NPDC004542 TaxID=3154281 RepID=UPI0033BCB54E
MLKTRSTAVTAGIVAATALVAGGITYASAASGPVAEAPAVQRAEAAQAPVLGTGTGADPGAGGKGNEGVANVGGFVGNVGGNGGGGGYQGKGNEGRHENRDRDHEDEGRIEINERTYSARPGNCITVLLLGGATSLNIRNESRSTVEVYNGVVCDNGAPLTTVGPHSSSYGVVPATGAFASFRVIRNDRDHGWN